MKPKPKSSKGSEGKCRICEALDNKSAIGCSEYEFITPYEK